MATYQTKIGVIVATHGQLAKSLVETTHSVLGIQSRLIPFNFEENASPQKSFKNLEQAILKANQGEGVVLLVDLFGGTPASLALSMLDEDYVEVITGVNLPMTLTAATLNPRLKLQEATKEIFRAGNSGIRHARDVLKK